MKKRWGWMLTLLRGKEFKVKALYFEEGKSISHQKHAFRHELWLFVFGSGTFIGSNPQEVKAGQWRLVHKDEWHQYTARKPTLVIEIQFGSKVSERDIVRT